MDARAERPARRRATEFVASLMRSALLPAKCPTVMSRPMNILFAPDYRAGVPYQTLLADALYAAVRTSGFCKVTSGSSR